MFFFGLDCLNRWRSEIEHRLLFVSMRFRLERFEKDLGISLIIVKLAAFDR
jgi:hypothetical protein